MCAVYRQARQRQHPPRWECWQAAGALIRAEPWRIVTLPISLGLAGFLEWALCRSGMHSPAFWGLMVVGVGAVMLGSVRLSLFVQARWERQPHREEDQ